MDTKKLIYDALVDFNNNDHRMMEEVVSQYLESQFMKCKTKTTEDLMANSVYYGTTNVDCSVSKFIKTLRVDVVLRLLQILSTLIKYRLKDKQPSYLIPIVLKEDDTFTVEVWIYTLEEKAWQDGPEFCDGEWADGWEERSGNT